MRSVMNGLRLAAECRGCSGRIWYYITIKDLKLFSCGVERFRFKLSN